MCVVRVQAGSWHQIALSAVLLLLSSFCMLASAMPVLCCDMLRLLYSTAGSECHSCSSNASKQSTLGTCLHKLRFRDGLVTGSNAKEQRHTQVKRSVVSAKEQLPKL